MLSWIRILLLLNATLELQATTSIAKVAPETAILSTMVRAIVRGPFRGSALSSWLLVLVILHNGAQAMPTESTQTAAAAAAAATAATATTSATTSALLNDFAHGHGEPEQLLRRFRQESPNSIKHPRHYMDHDEAIERLNALYVLYARSYSTTATIVNSRANRPAAATDDDDPGLLYAAASENAAEPTTTGLSVISSDEEYERVLLRLKEEALQSSKHPVNYVADDEELKHVIERLSESDNLIESRLDRWNKNQPLVHKVELCPICHEDMDPAESKLHRMQCNHEFHRHCIETWFKTMSQATLRQRDGFRELVRVCPLCRRRDDSMRFYQEGDD